MTDYLNQLPPQIRSQITTLFAQFYTQQEYLQNASTMLNLFNSSFMEQKLFGTAAAAEPRM